jgi:hypothetical protein
MPQLHTEKFQAGAQIHRHRAAARALHSKISLSPDAVFDAPEEAVKAEKRVLKRGSSVSTDRQDIPGQKRQGSRADVRHCVVQVGILG